MWIFWPKNGYFTPWALRAHFTPSARSFLARRLFSHNRELCYNRFMAYIRKFETASGATGIQVLYKEQGKVVKTVHIGSATTEKGITKLLKKAQAIIDEDKSPLFNLSKYDG